MGRLAGGGFHRCLRVALVRGGHIEQERLCRDGGTVSVGGAESATLVLPDAPRQPLFERSRDGYVLRLAAGMRARIATKEQVRHVEGPASVPLGRDARGRVEIGSVGVLFQMTAPPPTRPRPALPSSVRGGFLAGIDWAFSGITVASFLAFCAFVLALESMDFPIADRATIPESVTRLIMEEPTPPPDDPVVRDAAEDAPDPDERVVADATPSPSQRKHRRPRVRPSTDRAPSLVDATEVRRAVLLELGTLLGSGVGAALDEVRQGAPTTRARDVLDQVEGVARAANDDASFRPRERDGCTGTEGACGTRGVADLGRLTDSGGDVGPVNVGEVVEARVVPVVGFDPIDEPVGPGFFDGALVSAEVRRRLRAIRACYEHRLGPHPDLAGKVTAEITIQPAGNVTGVRAVENTTGSTSLAGCVEDSLRTIRFRQGPDGGPVTFRYPFVFATQR